MPARFDLYSAWIDPRFYAWGVVFAAALFLFVYSLRRFLALKGAAPEAAGPAPEGEAEINPFLEEPAEEPAVQAEAAPQEEKTLVLAPGEQQAFLAAAEAAVRPAAAEEPAPAEEAAPPAELPAEEARPAAQEEPAPAPAPREDRHAAENFVRGIYAGISDLDGRMKGIEAALSKGRVNNDFTVKFLEDMLQDMENLDKSKIRARIEYLLSDLKK